MLIPELEEGCSVQAVTQIAARHRAKHSVSKTTCVLGCSCSRLAVPLHHMLLVLSMPSAQLPLCCKVCTTAGLHSLD